MNEEEKEQEKEQEKEKKKSGEEVMCAVQVRLNKTARLWSSFVFSNEGGGGGSYMSV